MANDRVDREAKIIRGYSVMTIGEAKGHGFAADKTTLEQVIQLGNASASGVKSRIIHPERKSDGSASDRLLAYVGKSKNFRREGDKVLADLHISAAAFVSPEGDYGNYLMARAEEDEGDGFGASPEIKYTLAPAKYGPPVLRIKELQAIAIVDDPATNTAFFAALPVKEPEMAEAADPKLADLTAERDLLAGEVARLKAENAKFQADLTAKNAELAVAKSEAASKATADERARVADILALCSKAGKADLSAKHISDGTATADLQKTLFEVLCAANKPVGEGDSADLSAKPDENADYRKEYAANAYLSARMSEADYIASRRIDDGKDSLIKTKAA